MNRDLPRRVKQGSKASYVRRAVVNDIKLAKDLIEFYDKKAELWQYRQGKEETTEEGGEGEEEAAQDNVRRANTERGEDTRTHARTYTHTLFHIGFCCACILLLYLRPGNCQDNLHLYVASPDPDPSGEPCSS